MEVKDITNETAQKTTPGSSKWLKKENLKRSRRAFLMSISETTQLLKELKSKTLFQFTEDIQSSTVTGAIQELEKLIELFKKLEILKNSTLKTPTPNGGTDTEDNSKLSLMNSPDNLLTITFADGVMGTPVQSKLKEDKLYLKQSNSGLQAMSTQEIGTEETNNKRKRFSED